jgi:hypothetical protein
MSSSFLVYFSEKEYTDLAENVCVNDPPESVTSVMLVRLSVALVLSLDAAVEVVLNPLTVAVISDDEVLMTTSCALLVELIFVATTNKDGLLDVCLNTNITWSHHTAEITHRI